MTARPTAIIVIGLAALFFLSAPMTAREGTRPPGRNLTDYANPDGRPPDGIDDGTDDTPAPRQAVAAGPGVVYVGPGFYRWGKVSIPSGVAVVGAGAATVVRSSGPKQIFVQKAAQEWVIRDLVLDGEAKGDWKERRDAGQNGIFTEGCWGFEIAGVVLRNFNGAGLELTQTNLGAAGSSHGGNLERITATGNYVGVRFDIRAEYLKATELSCFYNVVGVIIHAGNSKITASNFGANMDGILIDDKDNGSHGSISNCLVNHNKRYALLVRNVANGMAISDCCFFGGVVQIENSVGVNITSGIIAGSIKTVGAGANRIAGNYVIPVTCTYAFSPSTIVRDNFTKAGPWAENR